MSEKRHPIVEAWLRGENDTGGCIAALERELAHRDAYAAELHAAAAEFEAPLSIYCDGPERDRLRAALANNQAGPAKAAGAPGAESTAAPTNQEALTVKTDPFDCRTFHELCMDYRGATIVTTTYNAPQVAYEKLQAYCRGVMAQRGSCEEPLDAKPTGAELEAILQPGNPKPVGRCATTQTERYRVEGCDCATYPGNEGLPCLTWCQSRAADRCAYCDHNLDCHRRLSAMFKNDASTEKR